MQVVLNLQLTLGPEFWLLNEVVVKSSHDFTTIFNLIVKLITRSLSVWYVLHINTLQYIATCRHNILTLLFKELYSFKRGKFTLFNLQNFNQLSIFF